MINGCFKSSGCLEFQLMTATINLQALVVNSSACCVLVSTLDLANWIILCKAVGFFSTLIQSSFQLLFLCFLSSDLEVETREFHKKHWSCREVFELKSALYTCVRASKVREFIPGVLPLKLPAIHREMFTALSFFFHLNWIHQENNPKKKINSVKLEVCRGLKFSPMKYFRTLNFEFIQNKD